MHIQTFKTNPMTLKETHSLFGPSMSRPISACWARSVSTMNRGSWRRRLRLADQWVSEPCDDVFNRLHARKVVSPLPFLATIGSSPVAAVKITCEIIVERDQPLMEPCVSEFNGLEETQQ
jgi:hypothetical protein